MSGARFALLVPQDAPFSELVARCRHAEDLGFDAFYVADHTSDYRAVGSYWLDGWTVLAALAVQPLRIRLGTLVSNPIIRPPVLLANEALAVDQLSGGRLELGIGTGIASFDFRAMGLEDWSAAERAARITEYVEIVDGVLRVGEAFAFHGRFYRTEVVPRAPAPVQRPRPPITIGGQSPTVRRIAAERADCWNTHGPFGRTAEEILEITRRQNAELDEMCAARGREPATLRRSLLLYGALDAWSSPDAVGRIIPSFHDAGMREFVLLWPPSDRLDAFERVAAEVLPAFRG